MRRLGMGDGMDGDAMHAAIGHGACILLNLLLF